MPTQEVVLVSSCLAGLRTRYDNRIVHCSECLKQLDQTIWIPVCPEQLGGLPTPRPPAHLEGGSGRDILQGNGGVVDLNGRDVTEHFINGARQVLGIAQSQKITRALLKRGSPSCGVTLSGITACLLEDNGIALEEYG